ncbi:DUF3093 domain-containing protein [Nocardioides marmotae]|uniref:DUF3093 family protein n=1 Tax=Nocardioides marmotae TaxID=2663857 RepID=A0A6I3J644_9ACTN|nr:DUF3093 domain-containing protein [Nocardioides marmotae]MCR6031244.1 DUF3093 family protein [Gordonia jinghuaiqii]MBC9731959.1 DUF3093 domain-containing protein [Nocardioides marmotae]MTB83080.1 DUF3093 family protein [Nocardioides marmotae]MTB94882.1 DUF3093 family protein [Nocardioides marmotae]QKE01140.1 DUF3093 domain-containing protein [Nocardioides marmotae]
MSTPVQTPPADHRERLHAPLRWWVQTIMFVASLWLALVVAIPGVIAWSVSALLLLIALGLLAGYGAAPVVVADGELRAGRARIGVEHLGEARALDAEETKRVAGPEADARAYLLLRPYLKRAVRVEITDPADPAPYWLICTRHPDRLTAAITAARAGAGDMPA